MKTFIFPLLLLFLISCGGEQQNTETAETTTTEPTPQEEVAASMPPVEESLPTETDNDPLGMYVGEFRARKYDHDKKPSFSNKITLSINRIDDKNVYGHSVVAGNIRPFEGSVTKVSDQVYEFAVKEPGDDRYDGAFNFSLNLARDIPLVGEWIANDSKLAVYEREYSLKKKAFAYQAELEMPEDVLYDGLYDTWTDDAEAETLTNPAIEINASTQVLQKEDVENLYKADLEFIRNAIYARHGYSFKNRRVRYVFDNYVGWYMPVSTDIRDQLTDLEKDNIALLKRYEEHADTYYDSFGR